MAAPGPPPAASATAAPEEGEGEDFVISLPAEFLEAPPAASRAVGAGAAGDVDIEGGPAADGGARGEREGHEDAGGGGGGGEGAGGGRERKDEDDERSCRVCLESCSERTGCHCRGTVQWAHKECLELWCLERMSRECELCHGTFDHIDMARVRRRRARREMPTQRIGTLEKVAWVLLAISPVILLPVIIVASSASGARVLGCVVVVFPLVLMFLLIRSWSRPTRNLTSTVGAVGMSKRVQAGQVILVMCLSVLAMWGWSNAVALCMEARTRRLERRSRAARPAHSFPMRALGARRHNRPRRMAIAGIPPGGMRGV